MGLMARILDAVFGGGRNAVAETLEVFRANAEAEAGRVSTDKAAALAQFAAEFSMPKRGLFDRAVDGINRLPRPAMALGCIALFASAMADPAWFAERMAGLAQVPEPLWWLMGAVVSFYFGARHQAKGQEFRRALAATLAASQRGAAAPDPADEAAPAAPAASSGNAALDAWRGGA